jgi:hypothetical protein
MPRRRRHKGGEDKGVPGASSASSVPGASSASGVDGAAVGNNGASSVDGAAVGNNGASATSTTKPSYIPSIPDSLTKVLDNSTLQYIKSSVFGSTPTDKQDVSTDNKNNHTHVGGKRRSKRRKAKRTLKRRKTARKPSRKNTKSRRLTKTAKKIMALFAKKK